MIRAKYIIDGVLNSVDDEKLSAAGAKCFNADIFYSEIQAKRIVADAF
ncbi:MAG: hypothetical protein ACM3SY_01600 [Candidatus Omnitrophota bacterium]